MKNKHIIYLIVAIIIVLVVAIFTAKQLKEPKFDGIKVFSDDATVVLEIPTDALPDGITEQDISISKSGFTYSDEGDILSYELQPDGLSFKQPINITLKTDLPQVTEEGYPIPLLLHKTIDGENVTTDIVDNTYVLIDEENNELSISGKISHFSNIALWQVGGLIAGRAHSDSTTHKIGDTFTFKATIQPTKRSSIFRDDFGYDEFTYAWGTTWGVDGKVTTAYANYITPTEREIPRRTGLTIHQSFDVNLDFTCSRRGRESVGAGHNETATKVRYTINQKRWSTFGQRLELLRERNHDYTTQVGFRERHECLEEDQQPAQTYTSTSKASADPSNLNCSGVELLSADDGGKEVPVYKLKDGKCYPAEQFHTPSNRDECPEVHYHYTVKSIDGHFRNDSQPCGSVRNSDITGRGSIWIE